MKCPWLKIIIDTWNVCHFEINQCTVLIVILCRMSRLKIAIIRNVDCLWLESLIAPKFFLSKLTELVCETYKSVTKVISISGVRLFIVCWNRVSNKLHKYLRAPFFPVHIVYLRRQRSVCFTFMGFAQHVKVSFTVGVPRCFQGSAWLVEVENELLRVKNVKK